MSPDKFVDYYEILQVSPMAEAGVIDAAYKKLAQKYHPDVNKNAESAERMKKINAAYEVLGNHERRKNYHAQWLKGKSATYNSRGHHIYFTADLHLHHKNIIHYCHRKPPFRNIDEMDKGLIANWNSVITNSDKVYHLGDFFSTNDSRVYGKAMHMFHGRTVFLRGNHDKGLQHGDYFMCRRMGGMKIFMRHWPPWEHPKRHIHSFDIPFDIDVILCGHVHDKWKFHVHIVGHRRIPVINVGVDVWGYKPVDLTSIKEEVGRFVTL